MRSKPGYYELIYQIVNTIPFAKVATYGQIALLAGNPRAARAVGWALHQLSDEQIQQIPWHRVINREGRISTKCLDHTACKQARLLKKEGVRVKYKGGNYWIDLDRFQWKLLFEN